MIKTYNEFYQSKEKLDSIFFKTDNYMNPRSINLYLNYVYHYNSDYKMRKKLKKRLKLALEKLSILVKNEKSLTVSNNTFQKTKFHPKNQKSKKLKKVKKLKLINFSRSLSCITKTRPSSKSMPHSKNTGKSSQSTKAPNSSQATPSNS